MPFKLSRKAIFLAVMILLIMIFCLSQCRTIKKDSSFNKIIVKYENGKENYSSAAETILNDRAVRLASKSPSTYLQFSFEEKNGNREARSVPENGESELNKNSGDEEEGEGATVIIISEVTTEESITTVYYDSSNETELPGSGTTPLRNDYEFRNSIHLNVGLYVRDVRDIDETAEILTLVINGRIKWKDPDLNKTFFIKNKRDEAQSQLKTPAFFKDMWIPDVRLQPNDNLSEKSLIKEPSRVIYYHENNEIHYATTRRTVKFNCEMDFKYYPADIQNCIIAIENYDVHRLITMEWDFVRAYGLTDNNFAVQIQSYEGGWKVEHPGIKYNAYRWIEFTMSMRRKISYHVVQTYLPSVLYILITCLCFLVPSHMVEVRIGISMTTLLTLTAMFASVRESTPTVSYIKAIDIWMAFCIFFVFLTLLEFTTLLWLRSQREATEKKRQENQRMLNALKNVIGGKCVGGPVSGLIERSFSVESLEYSRHEKFAELVEKYGFVVFSLVFLTFNIIYWSWLIEASGYYKWEINKTANRG